LTLSPDGTRLVYRSREGLSTRLFDQPKATPLAGTEGADDPFRADGRKDLVGSEPVTH